MVSLIHHCHTLLPRLIVILIKPQNLGAFLLAQILFLPISITNKMLIELGVLFEHGAEALVDSDAGALFVLDRLES